jgi:hypothetical protein
MRAKPAETTSETITKTRWGWPLLVAAASINCIGRLTMVPVQGDAVKGARPRLPADEGSHEVAPGPIRLTKRCAPEAMPAMSPCSARGLRNECRGSNFVDYRMLTPPAHPMNDGLSLYPQAGAVSCDRRLKLRAKRPDFFRNFIVRRGRAYSSGACPRIGLSSCIKAQKQIWIGGPWFGEKSQNGFPPCQSTINLAH